jgi:hypothetical protein
MYIHHKWPNSALKSPYTAYQSQIGLPPSTLTRKNRGCRHCTSHMIQLCAALTYGLHHSSGFDACIHNNKTILPAPTLKKRPKLHIIEYEKKNCIPNTQFKGTTEGCIGKPNKHGFASGRSGFHFLGTHPQRID